jgi:conjugal transfer mating pair stabilization protein TraN
MVENTYDCTSTTSGPSQTSCSASWVNGQQTITAQDDPDNNFAQAMAAINSAQSGSQSYQNAPDLKIFNGDDLRCKKAIFGLYNCCKDSGLLLGNLVSCSADEKKLYQEQSNTKACHYVGTYCSSKSLFGTCLEKKMSSSSSISPMSISATSTMRSLERYRTATLIARSQPSPRR